MWMGRGLRNQRSRGGVSPPNSQKPHEMYTEEEMNNTSKITQLKTIRIKNECAEYFRDKPLNRYVEWLWENAVAGRIELKGEEAYIIYKYNMWRYEKACRKVNADPELMFMNFIKEIEKAGKSQ